MRLTTSTEPYGTARDTTPHATPALRALLQRIEGEYREMPELILTASQAERLWGLDRSTCAFALTTLVERPGPETNQQWPVPSRTLHLVGRPFARAA
jgi:hypothetical protein